MKVDYPIIVGVMKVSTPDHKLQVKITHRYAISGLQYIERIDCKTVIEQQSTYEEALIQENIGKILRPQYFKVRY